MTTTTTTTTTMMMMMIMMMIHQGVIVGSLSGMLVLTWIAVGAHQMDGKYLALPHADVSRCSAAAANYSLLWQLESVDANWTTPTSSPDHIRNKPYNTSQVGLIYYANLRS